VIRTRYFLPWINRALVGVAVALELALVLWAVGCYYETRRAREAVALRDVALFRARNPGLAAGIVRLPAVDCVPDRRARR